jgi:hypothetical protein
MLPGQAYWGVLSSTGTYCPDVDMDVDITQLEFGTREKKSGQKGGSWALRRDLLGDMVE